MGVARVYSQYFQVISGVVSRLFRGWITSVYRGFEGVSNNVLLGFKATGCPTKKFTFSILIYLRPLILLRKGSVLEMNLWISSFKNRKSKFSTIFIFRDTKGIKHFLPLSEYIKLTFNPSVMSYYFKMACMWPKMIIFQV